MGALPAGAREGVGTLPVVARKGRGLAGCRPKGSWPRELAPGQGTRPSRPRPWQAVAVAETAGDVGGVEGSSRAGHAGVTEVPRIRHRSPTSSLRCREVHASARVDQQSRPPCKLCGRYSEQKDCSAVPGPLSRPEKRTKVPEGCGKCDVPGIFVTDRAEVWLLSRLPVTEVRLRDVPAPDPPRTPHVPGVSWRPQPARAATRRPGRDSDGRRRREARPSQVRRMTDCSGPLLAPRAVSRRPGLLDCASTSIPEEESPRDQG